MKRHSTKQMEKLGIFENLKNHIFIDKGKKYLFYMWDYNKGILYFVFREENDINKSLYDDAKSLYIQLYYQHLSDYENTLNLIYKGFDKVEEL